MIGRHGHPRLREGISPEHYAQLEHVIVSLHGGGFVNAVDNALTTLGYWRNVVPSLT